MYANQAEQPFPLSIFSRTGPHFAYKDKIISGLPLFFNNFFEPDVNFYDFLRYKFWQSNFFHYF